MSKMISDDVLLLELKRGRESAKSYFNGIDQVIDEIYDAVEDSVNHVHGVNTDKHGQWVYNGLYYLEQNIIPSWICSVCMSKCFMIRDGMFPFCPECGATMDGSVVE